MGRGAHIFPFEQKALLDFLLRQYFYCTVRPAQEVTFMGLDLPDHVPEVSVGNVFQGRPASLGFPGSSAGKESSCQCRGCLRQEFNPWLGKIPWRRAWQPTPVIIAWRILCTEGSGGLQSMGSQRVGHSWSDLAHALVHITVK